MTRTETAGTIHGEVEYEVVECDSCGVDVAKHDAKQFQIGDDLDSKYSRTVTVEGWACPNCASGGPIEFPRLSWLSRVCGGVYRSLLADPDIDSMFRLGAILYIAVSAVLWAVFAVGVVRMAGA